MKKSDFTRQIGAVNNYGIFKPAILPEIPLTIRTAPIIEGKPRLYDDQICDKGVLRYRYRGEDPMHRDNVGLRLAMQRRAPLIYLYGIVPGQYAVGFPVYIVGDNPGELCFTVAVGEKRRFIVDDLASGIEIPDTGSPALSASFIIPNCWMRLISCLTVIHGENHGSLTGWRCASCTMPPSTMTSWE